MTQAAERLRKIQRFDQLVAYLRDELDWPMDDYPFEDLTFDWDADELGIDLKTAAKIQEIKQLRPLAAGQEWGIFFVKFEPKQLPIVALRRLLNKLVIKKRASAQAPDMASWQMHDLLFVSQYGEGEHRKITFAHFTEGSGNGNPTLKVLDWDEDDTGNKLQYVDGQLRSHLRWPDNQEDADAWRNQWSTAFKLRSRQVIKTAKELASALAVLCRGICDETKKILDIETDNGPIRKLFQAFQQTLIHDLEEPDFADMYAQTITYGLFTAAFLETVADEGVGSQTYVDTERMVQMVPVTNPFLREMLSTFLTVGGRKGKLDFDELGVQEVVELLNDDRTDLNAVLRDFGNRGQGEDPVIHFYEDFLREYDNERKVQRGVFYTPQPVVSYIVRSVHELLQTDFDLEDGLADTTTWGKMAEKNKALTLPTRKVKKPNSPDLVDEPIDASTPFVQILDPATGTATFLVEVIDVIHRTMSDKWKKSGKSESQCNRAWNEYVPQHLLPRLHGYELMMAPYAIAHMKIGLKLTETGYRFESNERAHIYLTNALEPASDASQKTLGDWFPALAHESNAVNRVKRDQRFTVVIGNPPYANYGQLNRLPFVLDLLNDYKKGLNEKKLNLDDDFIKFIRFSQHILEMADIGVLGMITNNVYIDGITHRRMRESLAETFSSTRILDLHGNSKRRETAPGGNKDENVFDILIGVSIILSHKTPGCVTRSVEHADLWGLRNHKYSRLLAESAADTTWKAVQAKSPHFFFVPKDFSAEEEYGAAFKIEEVFNIQQNGLKTDRDDLFYDYDKTRLFKRIALFFSKEYGQEFKDRYRVVASSSFDIEQRREQTNFDEGRIRQCLYRPLDLRWLYYDPKLTSRPAEKVMRHMTVQNLALVTGRQGQVMGEIEWDLVACSPGFVDTNLFYRGGNIVFPLYLTDEKFGFDLRGSQNAKPQERSSNFTRRFLKVLAASLAIPQSDNEGLPQGLTPEDIFYYAYGVFYSPSYRNRYAEFLKIDFPRLPLPGTPDFFHALARLGGEVVALHRMESLKLNDGITTVAGSGDFQVEKVSYSDETVWIDKAKTRGFKGVPDEVWNFHIGGYQVCEKWLKDRQAKGGKNPRPGRILTDEDIDQYQKIVVALSETIRIMDEIDEVIKAHGGWPDAFVTEPIEVDEKEPLLPFA